MTKWHTIQVCPEQACVGVVLAPGCAVDGPLAVCDVEVLIVLWAVHCQRLVLRQLGGKNRSTTGSPSYATKSPRLGLTWHAYTSAVTASSACQCEGKSGAGHHLCWARGCASRIGKLQQARKNVQSYRHSGMSYISQAQVCHRDCWWSGAGLSPWRQIAGKARALRLGWQRWWHWQAEGTGQRSGWV